MKTAFFTLEPWAKEYVQKKTSGTLDAVFFDEMLSADRIPPQTDFEAISVFVDSQVSEKVIDAFPALKLIATRSTGYDHIPVVYAEGKGIAVASVPAYGANTVAEYAFALLLSLSRRIYHGSRRMREEGRFEYDGLRGFDLRGKTIGIIGTGNIGKHAIAMAKGFGMNVLASDPYPKEELAKELGFTYKSFNEVIAVSDVVTIHVPYMGSTHHIFNRDTIATMKKGAVLINTSRGAVVETVALAEALKSGHLGGAGLDVLEEEGIIKDEINFLVRGTPDTEKMKVMLANHMLVDMPHVIVTPHNAFNTEEALIRILDTTIENIQSFKNGTPVNVVKG